MRIPIKTNLEIFPCDDNNVKLKTFNGGIRIKRFVKRAIRKSHLSTNLKVKGQYIMGFIVIMAIFSFESFVFSKPQNQNLLIGKWIWRESIHVDNMSYLSTPKLMGFRRSIVFTNDGNVITYKNDIEIRVSKYELSRGTSIFDQQVHDLLTYEGGTYVIEELNNKQLVLTNNSSDGYRSRFYR